jgi:hypothetical protein
MKKGIRFILAVCAVLICASAVNAQTPESKPTATVYIYKMPHALTMGRIAVPIIIDGKDVAHLDKNRYLIAKILIGRRVVQGKHKKTIPLQLDLKSDDVV